MRILIDLRYKEILYSDNLISKKEHILKYDSFFSGYYDGFKKNGNDVFLVCTDSFFLPLIIRSKFKYLVRIHNLIFSLRPFNFFKKLICTVIISLYCKLKKIDFYFSEINFNIIPSLFSILNSETKLTQWFGIFPDMVELHNFKMLKNYDFLWKPCIFNDDIEKQFSEINSFYIGCSANSDHHFYQYDSSLSFEIVLVGTLSKYHYERLEVIEYLANNFENFAFFGSLDKSIHLSNEASNSFMGWADNETYRKTISSSKISINLTLDSYEKVVKGFNARLFELASIGGALQLVSQDNKIDRYFRENEVIQFKNLANLVEICNYFLDENNEEERQMIVKASKEKVQNYYYINRAKKIEQIVSKEILNDNHNFN